MEILDFLDEYLGEIVVSLTISIILGIWGIIRSFFQGIKKMNQRIDKLESDLETNTRSDEQLTKYVDAIIQQKLKQ